MWQLRPGYGSWLPRLVAVLFALGAALTGVYVVVAIEAPHFGLLGVAWRALADGGTVAIVIVGGVAAVNLAVEVLVPSNPAYDALLSAALDGPYDPFGLAIVGYLLGVVVAEFTRREPVHIAGGARLDARSPAGYLTGTARWLPIGLAALTVAAVAVNVVAGLRADVWPAIGAVVLTGAMALAQHLVLRRPQRLTDADALALDDMLRSGATHALAGATSALLLAWTLAQVALAVTTDGAIPGVIGIVLGVASIGGVYGSWMYYGSEHRGRRPGRVENATP